MGEVSEEEFERLRREAVEEICNKLNSMQDDQLRSITCTIPSESCATIHCGDQDAKEISRMKGVARRQLRRERARNIAQLRNLSAATASSALEALHAHDNTADSETTVGSDVQSQATPEEAAFGKTEEEEVFLLRTEFENQDATVQ